jgi:uncharacterized membrane protein YhaH (DUF805 family)
MNKLNNRTKRPNYLEGRTNRATYWASLVLAVILSLVIGVVAPRYARVTPALLIIIGVPRLHDIGRSGWWLAALFAVEVVATFLLFANYPTQVARVGLGIVTLMMWALVVWLGSVPGEATPNRFGARPAKGLDRFWRINRP